MKLRIKDNSLRLRLSRSEVDRLSSEGYLEDRTEFGNSAFIYALQTKKGITDLEAGFSDNKMTMYVPADIPAIWATNETVGYSNNMRLADGKELFLLLEKDFKCIDNSAEDQSDNFENPKAVC
jgi:hypothetical protein